MTEINTKYFGFVRSTKHRVKRRENVSPTNKNFVCNEEYTIADIAIWSWYGALVLGRLYGAEEFLDVQSYKNVMRWAKAINERPAVKRGRMVNKITGHLGAQLHERHDSTDFIHKTQDKIEV